MKTNKNLFIVTSCVKPKISTISNEIRYQQTLETFDSVRRLVPDSIIYFSDASYYELTPEEKEELTSNVDVFFDFSQDETMKQFNEYTLKSHGECYMLLKTLFFIREQSAFNEISRMFKLGGRCKLTENFNINDYDNTQGKFIFKTRVNSWMDKGIQESYGSPYILETRLYSWCSTLIDEYIQILIDNFTLFEKGLDTEHSHFISIPKEKILEFENMNCECMVAGINNNIMVD